MTQRTVRSEEGGQATLLGETITTPLMARTLQGEGDPTVVQVWGPLSSSTPGTGQETQEGTLRGASRDRSRGSRGEVAGDRDTGSAGLSGKAPV